MTTTSATNPVALDLAIAGGQAAAHRPGYRRCAAGQSIRRRAGRRPAHLRHRFPGAVRFVFHPESEAIYGTDNTPYTCEELNIIRGGQNYGWPNVGEFPFAQCGIGDQVAPIHYFAREGKQPGEFVSLVEVTGLAFTPASAYPALGDSLVRVRGAPVGDREARQSPGVLRRLGAGGGVTSVSGDDLITRDCKGDVEAAPDGTLYYANASEIRRLLPAGAQAARDRRRPP